MGVLGGSGGGSAVSFPGVFMSTIYTLKACPGGAMMSSCSAVKLPGEIYGEVNQLIPHCQFYPGLLCEIRYPKSKAYPGPLHSSERSSLPYKRLLIRGSCLLLCFPYLLALDKLFSNILPPYSKHIVPSP